jgi:dipeptidyl aminopeptidase/acylaminoacyl peptidase
VEAMDKGDPSLRVSIKDMIYTMAAPFNSSPIKLAACYMRFNKINWGDDQLAIVTERWWKTRAERRVYIKPGNERYRVNLFDHYYENAYADPGVFITRHNEYNRPVLLTENNNIFTISEGASPQGNRPFILKFNIKTKLTDTIFRSKAPYYEKPVFFSNRKFLITSREAVDSVPNYYYVGLPGQKHLALTSFSDPYPGLKGIQRRLISYKRNGGLNLSGTLYLPKGYKEGSARLPVLIWAYPREYKTAAAAGQVKGSPYQFTRIGWGSPVYWVTQGYAVLDNADMPIVGII